MMEARLEGGGSIRPCRHLREGVQVTLSYYKAARGVVLLGEGHTSAGKPAELLRKHQGWGRDNGA